MKKNLLIILLLLNFVNLKASSIVDSLKTTINSDTSYLQKNFVSLNLILPGFSFERKVGKNSTLYASAGLTYSGSVSEYNSGGYSYKERKNYVNPRVSLDYRNYYNFDKRLNKNKNITHNSANYFGVTGSYMFNPISQSNIVLNYLELGPIWGFQRTYKSGFYFDLNLGLGYINAKADNIFPFTDGDGNTVYLQDDALKANGLAPIGNIHLGFYIGKK